MIREPHSDRPAEPLRPEGEEEHTGLPSANGGGPDRASPDSIYDHFGSGTLLLFFTGCLLSYFLFQAVFWGGRPGAGVWGLALAPVMGILLPVVLLLRGLQRRVRAELWWFKLSGRQALGVLLVMLGTIPITYALAALNGVLVTPDARELEFQKNLVPVDASSFAGGICAVVILAPLGEEVLFRAILLGTLARHVRPVVAVVLGGVVFGMTHLTPWVLLPLSFLGVILGLLVLITRTLTAAWVGHALFNLTGYLELARTGDVETPALTRLALQPLVLVAATVVLALAFRYLRAGAENGTDVVIA